MKILVKFVQIYSLKSQGLLLILESNITIFYKNFLALDKFTCFKMLINLDDKFNQISAKFFDRIISRNSR